MRIICGKVNFEPEEKREMDDDSGDDGRDMSVKKND